MEKKNITILGLILGCIILLLPGCGNKENIAVNDYVTAISDITMEDNVKIIGLGEATHGNVEFQTLKKDVFEAVLNNNGCKIFAIEGDFGGGLKVNDYIQGGEGSAKEASAELGFAIYRTKQMENLIQWMRDYNEKQDEENRIRFYGFDMQRYDNSKEILFSYLEKAGCTTCEDYKKSLTELNDETVYDQKNSVIKEGKANAEIIQQDLEKNKALYIAATDEKSYSIACECIKAIIENTELQMSSTQYGTLRDEYMKQRVSWIYDFEGQQLMFITGHDGHIDKSSAVKGYTSMGKLLTEEYGDDYFAIGTDFHKGNVNIVTSSGERKNMFIKNQNELTSLFENETNNVNYLDFTKAADNPQLQNIINSRQKMVNIGATLDSYQKILKMFYTLKMKPQDAYDSVIIVNDVTPTEPWQLEE